MNTPIYTIADLLEWFTEHYSPEQINKGAELTFRQPDGTVIDLRIMYHPRGDRAEA